MDASTDDGAAVLWQIDPWRAPVKLAGPVEAIISGANLDKLASPTVTVGGVEAEVLDVTPGRIYI